VLQHERLAVHFRMQRRKTILAVHDVPCTVTTLHATLRPRRNGGYLSCWSRIQNVMKDVIFHCTIANVRSPFYIRRRLDLTYTTQHDTSLQERFYTTARTLFNTMLLWLFIVLQVICFAAFALAFREENVVIWGSVMVISALLAIGAWGIQISDVTLQNSTVVVNQTSVLNLSTNTTTVSGTTVTKNNYDRTTTTQSDPSLMGLNIGIFGLSLLYFFLTLFKETPYKS